MKDIPIGTFVKVDLNNTTDSNIHWIVMYGHVLIDNSHDPLRPNYAINVIYPKTYKSLNPWHPNECYVSVCEDEALETIAVLANL